MGRSKRIRQRKKQQKHNALESPEEYLEVLKLQKWLNIKNLHFKIKSFKETGRGVKSDRKIKPGEELVAIPLEAMITLDVVNRSNISHIFTDSLPSPEIAIAFWLMHEKHLNQESSFADYLNVLPKSFDSLIFCPNVEIKALPLWIQKPVKDKIKEADEGYEKSLSCLGSSNCHHCDSSFLDIFSKDSFLWAWLCVNTRCVYFEDEKMNEDGEMVAVSSIAMAPYLDLFNHSNSANVEAKLDCQRRVYSLTTNTPYNNNEQIFIKYGAFPNLRLLVEYGFILDDDDQDVVEFTFEEVLKAAKSINLQYGDVSKLKYKFISMNSLNVQLSKGKDEFSWNCKGLLYILVTQDTNLAELLSKTYSSRCSDSETQIITRIQETLIQQKEENLILQLRAMENIQPCTKAFQLAKSLVRQFLNILKN